LAVGLVDRLYDGAGRSGGREYRRQAREWRRAVFGRRAVVAFWLAYAIALLTAMMALPDSWDFTIGGLFGAAAMAALLLPQTLMPDRISRRERGQWGEQKTARVLRPLKGEGWVIRHDLARGFRHTNHDHIAAGRGVYLFDSKLVAEVKESYVDVMRRRAYATARSLERKLKTPSAFLLPSTQSS